MRARVLTTLFSIALTQGCSDDPELTCGTGTRQMGNACVPISTLGCGAGTKELDGACVPDGTFACGAGTQVVDGECVPISVTMCGDGTQEVNGQCVPTALVGQHYLNPMVQLQSLHEVGSHTDEVRIREDGLLFNCSYTFNIIDAENANDMEALNEGGSRHVSPSATRAPGCKHLAWDDGNHVFLTHPGNIRDGLSFLSAWDITDPEAPEQETLLQEPGVTYQGVAYSNGSVFVGLREGGLGVYRFDVPTTTTSTIPGRFVRIGGLGGFTNAWGMVARDNTVFMTDLAEAFVTVDVTDPTQPVELGRVALGGTSRFLDVDGDHAFVASGSDGVNIVDISDLANPVVVSNIDMPGTAVRVDYSEGRIFVAAWNDVRVYDVTDPTAPAFITAVRIRRAFDYDDADRELPTMRIFGVAARGQDVFIGAWENPYSYRLEPDRLAPNIRLPETSTRLDFGPVAVGQTKTLPLEVTNQGTAPLTLIDNWVSGEGYSVEPEQALVPPGESVTLNVTFAPTTTAEATGFVHIVSDDPEYPLRKPYLAGNSPGVTVGSPLPPTTATLIDGTIWNSGDTTGDVMLLFYFATF